MEEFDFPDFISTFEGNSMQTTPQSNHPAAARRIAFVGTRSSVLPRLFAVAAVGLLSLTACNGTNGAGASSAPGGSTGSGEASQSSGPDAGAITEGAADDAWKDQVRRAASEDSAVDATQCVDGLLDQKTLDAVATALPEVGGMYLGGLFTHAGCTFTGANDPNEVDGESTAHVATVQIRKYYLANDKGHVLDESGFLKHGQCADDIETDENGVATINKHGVSESNLHGGSAKVDLQAAWHCSDDGATSTAVLIHAADGEEDGFSDPSVLTESDLSVETATHLSETEDDWAPALDEIYEENFKEIGGQ